jgi:hypothetical protein
MTIRIELPPDEERAFVDRARLSGQDATQFARQIIRERLATLAAGSDPPAAHQNPQGLETLIDRDFVADCAPRPGEQVPTIEEVREALAKIPGSMAEEIIADREDRF